jgi:hypothetical protein
MKNAQLPRKLALEDLTKFASQPRFGEFAIKCRNSYDLMVGGIHEDDQFYETRMIFFMEWLIFDAVVENGQTIYQIYVDERGVGDGTPEETAALEALAKQWRDVFTVKWSADGQMKLTALKQNKNIIVTDEEKSPSFRKGDLFSGRAFNIGEEWFLTNGICPHPSTALKAVKKEIKRIVKSGGGEMAEYLVRLTAMSVKWERFRNVAVSDIYKPMEG